MTKEKSFKKRVRERMARTGESYAAARHRLENERKAAATSPSPPAPDPGRERRRKYREASLNAWLGLTRELAPDGAAAWTLPADIVRVLNQIAELAPQNHTHHPDGGGLDLTGAVLGIEPHTIEINFQGRATIVRPQSLRLLRPNNDPLGEWAYFRLETSGLEPSEVYKLGSEALSEHVLELQPGEYVEGEHWDAGYFGHDDRGAELPLPASARPLTRYFRGPFLVVAKTSGYNASRHTYRGVHAKVTASEFEAQILRLVAELHERGVYGRDLRG